MPMNESITGERTSFDQRPTTPLTDTRAHSTVLRNQERRATQPDFSGCICISRPSLRLALRPTKDNVTTQGNRSFRYDCSKRWSQSCATPESRHAIGTPRPFKCGAFVSINKSPSNQASQPSLERGSLNTTNKPRRFGKNLAKGRTSLIVSPSAAA
jgi:hypothetical protein